MAAAHDDTLFLFGRRQPLVEDILIPCTDEAQRHRAIMMEQEVQDYSTMDRENKSSNKTLLKRLLVC